MAAMTPEEEEGYDLPVYCMNEGSTTFSNQEKMRVLLQFDRKVFDGQLDEIKGTYQSS